MQPWQSSTAAEKMNVRVFMLVKALVATGPFSILESGMLEGMRTGSDVATFTMRSDPFSTTLRSVTRIRSLIPLKEERSCPGRLSSQ